MSDTRYELLTAESSDVPAVAALWLAAFANDPIVYNLDAGMDAATKQKEGERWHRSLMDRSHLYGSVFRKAIDTTTGEIVGYGVWMRPITLTDSQKAEKATIEAQDKLRKPAEGTNVSLCKDFFQQLREKREKWIKPENDYYFNLLGTSPSHHRRGIGSLILKECLDEADRNGARIYIEASAIGRPLYLRRGWEQVDEIIIDLDKHDAARFSGTHIEAILLRLPRPVLSEAEK